ncbi:MAG TPA: LamG domain-containing protein [Polyangiales bacterium]|nr:LamG domain-containing protein [Polyangiales bacterium]
MYDPSLVDIIPQPPHGGAHGGAGASGRGGQGGAGDAGRAASGGGGGRGGTGAAGGDAGRGGSSGAGTGGAGASGAGGAAGGGGGGSGGTDDDAGACMPQLEDCCPQDANKTDPGVCGCGASDADSDHDGTPNCVDAAAYGWQRRLTIDGAQVTAALTDFPVLVVLTDSQLAATAAASGEDIYFTADDGTTLLDFELERYTSASGALVAWVRLPNLSAGTDTAFHLGYDDGKSNRSNAAGVWAGYHNVWHLGEDPSGGASSIKDSTQRAHGTPQGSMNASARMPGIAGDGLAFDGTDDQIAFNNDITGNGPSTLSGWVFQATDNGDYGSAVISIGNGTTGQARFLLSSADSDRVKGGFYGNDDLSTSVLTIGQWSFVAWTSDTDGTRVFVNGVSVLGPASHSNVNTTGTNGRIGNTTFTYEYFLTGRLDEVRIATAARSSAWIAAEYANQRPGATFIKSVGAAEAAVSH